MPDSPYLLAFAMIVMLIEGAALSFWRRRTGRGLSVGATWRMLLPGLCLTAVAWSVSVGGPWLVVPLALTAALTAHIVDLLRRWRG